MIRLSSIAIGIWLAVSAAAKERHDLLRFSNGDQLHGAFLGIKPGPFLTWMSEDVGEPVDFKTARLRHVVLHGGRPRKPMGELSHVSLGNGDRIPGTITRLDGETLTLDSPCAGPLRIPRQQVSMLAPNPLGGRVFYHGPFSDEDWIMVDAAHPDGLPPAADADADVDEPEKPDAERGEESGRWEFSGSSWYWNDDRGCTALVRRDGMPDRVMLRFELAWKSRMALAVGFHSDFARPKPDDDGDPKIPEFSTGDSSALPWLFGNSYVLQLNSNYLMLFRTAVDADGRPSVERIQSNVNQLRLGETGRALVELRCSRSSGRITLFVDDEFVAQWSGSEDESVGEDGYAGKGSGFGFLVQTERCPVRISDVITSEWNGMPDSARSMQLDDQDILLMANGTDRFAGRVLDIDDGTLRFETKHGDFRLPVAEIAEVRFASDEVAAPSEEAADSVLVRYSPVGSISGLPLGGDGRMLRLAHPVAGEIDLSLESAVMLEFHASNRIIDDWDADF